MSKPITYEELCQREEELHCDKEDINEQMKKLRNENDKIVAKLGRIRRAKLKLLTEKMNSMIANLNVGEIKLITDMYDDCGCVSFKPKGSRYHEEVWFKLNDGITYDDIMNDDTKLEFITNDGNKFIEFFKLEVGEKCLTTV